MSSSILSDRPQSLPVPLTALVGREREVAQVCALLRQPAIRLVTLTGPGGVGKTRLALAVADELQADFADGVALVSLAPIRDPALVVSAISQALGVHEAAGEPLVQSLARALQLQRRLLVLDNFEQVLDAAPLITDLLGSCPSLNVLVTSRSVLRLSAEHDVRVPPLDLPETTRLPPIEQLAEIESVRLFVERARAARAGFALTAQNAPAVAAICARLDGLPLAIELAAARVRLLSPHALLALLEHRLHVLTGGPRDAPARQQTMRITIEWSVALLSPDEQRLLRQLAVFAGGWTLEAAAAVCTCDLDVLAGMSTLVDHSLVRHVEQPDGSLRFTMLETIREYGLERLTETGEAAEAIQRHTAYFLGLVERAEQELRGRGQAEWLARLDADHDNVRATLSTSLARGDSATALRIAVAFASYWHARSGDVEARRWLERALAAGASAPAATRAWAYLHFGRRARNTGDFDTSRQALEHAITLFCEVGDNGGLSAAITERAHNAGRQGEYAVANALYAEATDLARQSGDALQLADALAFQVLGLFNSREYQRARELGEESLALYRAAGDRRGTCRALGYLGGVALLAGDVDGAALLAEACLDVARDFDEFWTSFAIGLLGEVALERGDWHAAGTRLRERLAWLVSDNDFISVAECLESLAGVAGGLEDAARGATLLGAADAIRRRFGAPLPPPYRDRYDHTLRSVRASLSDDAFAAAWDAGRQMSAEELIQFALAPDVVAAVEPLDAAAAGLTKRELDVLRLLVEGQSNKEIAAALFIGQSTVASHVNTILAKLGVESRTAAATWAVREGIV